ncbi:MAG: methyltransferase domain-containing protein [Sandaracinaceae bacterium]|nr:methyltransferase domain-containing protein [Sandaracinaceae bacterium]
MTDFRQTGSILPSQRFLVVALFEAAQADRAEVIVEFGAGTGAMTAALLEKMPPKAKLYAIEIDGSMIVEIRRRIQDCRLILIHGSAAEAEDLLRQHGHRGEASVILSSLAMSLIPAGTREKILQSAARLLGPKGRFVQFGYIHTRYVTWRPECMFGGFDYESFLRSHFERVERRLVLSNLPPAWVYFAEGALKAGQERGGP